MQAKSFIEILANELRKEIRAEIEAEIAASRVSPASRIETSFKADQTALWLNLKMGGAFVGTVTRTSAYQTSAHRKQTTGNGKQKSVIRELPSSQQQTFAKPSSERVGKAETIEQTLALEFICREGGALGEVFTETELKTQFRKIAFHIHPDRHTQASVAELQSLASRFQTLVESAEILEQALS